LVLVLQGVEAQTLRGLSELLYTGGCWFDSRDARDNVLSLLDNCESDRQHTPYMDLFMRDRDEFEMNLKHQQLGESEVNPSVPDSIVSLPESVPSLPKAVPSLPKAVPSLPKAVPSLTESVPRLPESLPRLPDPVIASNDSEIAEDFRSGLEDWMALRARLRQSRSPLHGARDMSSGDRREDGCQDARRGRGDSQGGVSSSQIRSCERSSRSRSPRKTESGQTENEKPKELEKKCLPPIKKGHLTVCSRILWVGHLSKLVVEQDLSEIFGQCGKVNAIHVIPPRGCAFVYMDTRMDANTALKTLNKTKILGKIVKMAWAPSKLLKDKQWKDFWDLEKGCSYIPIDKVEPGTNLKELEEDCTFDEDTMDCRIKTMMATSTPSGWPTMLKSQIPSTSVNIAASASRNETVTTNT